MEFIDRNFDRDGSGKKLGVLIERATEQVIGFAGLLQFSMRGEQDYEIGFVLRRSAWGHGYATGPRGGSGSARCALLTAASVKRKAI